MSNSKALETALSIIDKQFLLDHKQIAKMIYAETGYCDQDYNKFLAVASGGSLTLKDYIRRRKLFFAVRDIVDNPQKTLAVIALEFGYSDQSALTRAVKNEYGKTPVTLRKEKTEIPDIRKTVEGFLTKTNRLEAIMKKIESDSTYLGQDFSYFDVFVHATEEFGFDVSTCCLISDLSEKLDIPFGFLLDKCFDMIVDFHNDPEYMPAHIDYESYISLDK